MKIKIYQVNLDRDENHAVFRGLNDKLITKNSIPFIDSSNYDCVFEGEVACENLEDVYRMFNLNHPKGYQARSLSVSDVVEVTGSEKLKNGFYFCNTVGFLEVIFYPTIAEQTATKINVDSQNETVWWMYLNTDADSGAQYVNCEISFDDYKKLLEQYDIANHLEDAERFASELEEMADQSLSDIHTPFFLAAQAEYQKDADYIEFTPENILKIYERILSYEVDREAEREIDREL